MWTPVTSKTRYRHSFRAGSLGLALLSGLAFASCKQGEGDVCQVDSDCEEGLVCVPGTSVCQKPGGSGEVADAAPRADADTTDAAIVDADVLDADLTDADLTDADLTDADLTDADLPE